MNMKKEYQAPAMTIDLMEVEPLLTLSPTDSDPSTQVNYEDYDGEFSARGYDGWEDND